MLDHLTQLARTVEGNWCAAWASLGAVAQAPRTLVDDAPECLRVLTPGEPESLVNMVMRYTAPGPVREADVERALEPYRRHRLPTQWWLLRDVEPEGLREGLRAVGLQSWGGATAMALALAECAPRYPVAPEDVTLRPVVAEEDAQAALAVICDVFLVEDEAMARWTTNNPAFRLYLARLHGQPVAALGILTAGDVAGVYHVATRAGARRRGIAGNLLLLALGEARAAGCAWATLTATPEARALYERLGFRAVGMMEQWMPGARLMGDLLTGRRRPPREREL